MDYSALLQDPRWQKKRLAILERDGWTCTSCECETRTLHVHHRVAYDGRDPWDYDDSELQTLCWYCHGCLKDVRPGSVEVFVGGYGYDGRCPRCGSVNMKDKGSFDKCLDCGCRTSEFDLGEAIYMTDAELTEDLQRREVR